MTTILAIDPGLNESAYCLLDGEVVQTDTLPNAKMRERLDPSRSWREDLTLVVEWMQPHGMATPQSMMDTAVELGRMIEVWALPFEKMSRDRVKAIICGSSRAKDGNVRQALIDRWGGEDAVKGPQKCKTCGGKGWVGRRHDPCPKRRAVSDEPGGNVCWERSAGPLYGVSGDAWAALALAVAWRERNK